jgi:serine/threonine protein kinase
LKPSNVLIGYNGEIKLTDFGLARYKSENDDALYTKNIATRWYRPPEVLFGGQQYNESVDVWAMGCILAELLGRKPLFRGDGDLDQLSKVFEIMGSVDVSVFGFKKNYANVVLSWKNIQKSNSCLISLDLII